jgi:hypothetical protein
MLHSNPGNEKPAPLATWPSPAEINACLQQAKLGVAPYLEDHAIATAFRARRDGPDGRVWGLLAEIFDIHFKPSDASNPFGPMWEGNGKRSMIPRDLKDEDLDALSATLHEIRDPEYRARIGDLLWLRRKDAAAARIAISEYLDSGRRVEDPAHWVTSMQRYERALRLARSLGKNDQLLNEVLDHLIARVRHYNGADKSWLTHRTLSLLDEFRGGDPAELGAIAAQAADNAMREGDLRRAREHYELVAKFLGRAGQSQKAIEALRAAAETFVGEAEERECNNSYMVAHKFWNDAIRWQQRSGRCEAASQ